MKMLPLLTVAALAAAPASAKTYTCRSDRGNELGVVVGDNRLSLDDGRKLTLLCGRGAAGRCTRTGDGGWNYTGALGMIQFVPESGVFAKPAVFRMQAPGAGTWTSYMCRVMGGGRVWRAG
ncbi:hypothetical protein OF829_15535 [Sphingomonas sp. LB-2]|uniref:hypothetical protein n=1 Tax=Sphingomonas caeni TaxID=2984949 RepID=UPI00222FCD2F|nr:hypothetical protein [Sphingomonas caeni]MCW3848647.1 hypothetical protein [Sphingomonas caeni]